jgi:MtN3 and saliva related transmembrane protein
MNWLTIFSTLQLFAGFYLAYAYIPQIIKILKTKNVGSFKLFTYVNLAIGIGLGMEPYAAYMYFVEGTAGAFFITNTLSTILVGTMATLIYIYQKREKSL